MCSSAPSLSWLPSASFHTFYQPHVPTSPMPQNAGAHRSPQCVTSCPPGRAKGSSPLLRATPCHCPTLDLVPRWKQPLAGVTAAACSLPCCPPFLLGFCPYNQLQSLEHSRLVMPPFSPLRNLSHRCPHQSPRISAALNAALIGLALWVFTLCTNTG